MIWDTSVAKKRSAGPIEITIPVPLILEAGPSVSACLPSREKAPSRSVKPAGMQHRRWRGGERVRRRGEKASTVIALQEMLGVTKAGISGSLLGRTTCSA